MQQVTLDTNSMIAEMHADWRRIVKEHDEHHAEIFGNGKPGLKMDNQLLKRDICALKWVTSLCLISALGLITRLFMRF